MRALRPAGLLAICFVTIAAVAVLVPARAQDGDAPQTQPNNANNAPANNANNAPANNAPANNAPANNAPTNNAGNAANNNAAGNNDQPFTESVPREVLFHYKPRQGSNWTYSFTARTIASTELIAPGRPVARNAVETRGSARVRMGIVKVSGVAAELELALLSLTGFINDGESTTEFSIDNDGLFATVDGKETTDLDWLDYWEQGASADSAAPPTLNRPIAKTKLDIGTFELPDESPYTGKLFGQQTILPPTAKAGPAGQPGARSETKTLAWLANPLRVAGLLFVPVPPRKEIAVLRIAGSEQPTRVLDPDRKVEWTLDVALPHPIDVDGVLAAEMTCKYVKLEVLPMGAPGSDDADHVIHTVAFSLNLPRELWPEGATRFEVEGELRFDETAGRMHQVDYRIRLARGFNADGASARYDATTTYTIRAVEE